MLIITPSKCLISVDQKGKLYNNLLIIDMTFLNSYHRLFHNQPESKSLYKLYTYRKIKLKTKDKDKVYHFFRTIFSAGVPVLAAINFFKSPIVSSGLNIQINTLLLL